MKASAVFVTAYPSNGMRTFLVIQGTTGYLVNYNHETDSFDYMCPCCTFDYHRRAIMMAVIEAVDNGKVGGEIRWCSRNENGIQDHGDRLGEYAPLRQEFFCAGDAVKDITKQTKAVLREASADYMRRHPSQP